MTTSQSCYPWFYGDIYGQLAQASQPTIASGCFVNSAGNIPCDPDAMRADAEAKLNALGYSGSLSLKAYTLGRYMQGEVGNGSIAERVAVGEAAVNRAASEGGDVNDLLLYRQPSGHPNRGFYGPIHGLGTGTSTAPYGRWATTNADPTLLTLLLAKLVADGDSDNFSNGADDQDGPEAWISQGQASLTNYVQNLAAHGKYWVGPLPGVDHWRTFLQFTPGPFADKDFLLAQGLQALQLPAERPQWGDLPICSKPLLNTKGLMWLAGIFGFLGGAFAFSKGYGRRFGL